MQKLLKNCELCPKSCGTDRFSGMEGFCGARDSVAVAKAFLHQWEEPCLSGTRGSGTVFFSGCNMKCLFCQNYDISQKAPAPNTARYPFIAKEISVQRLSDIFLELQEKGAHNINLVSPSPYVPQIIEATALARKKGLAVPMVYNSNGYEKVETIALLKGTVDIYLPDIKYFSNVYGEKYSLAKDYFAHASKAVLEMFEQVRHPEFDEEGILKKGLLIRHLVLPGLSEDSKLILKWIRENLGKYAYVSLMCQYIPTFRASELRELSRKLTEAEYDEVIDYFFEIGLENGFVQELESAEAEYVPNFDLSGL